VTESVQALGRRARKAAATRRRILAAAEELFVRDGYAATAITEIAARADVAVQTVYAVFGTKRAVLTELIDARIMGNASPLPDASATGEPLNHDPLNHDRLNHDRADPLRGLPEWQAMENEPDPRRQLARFAAIATGISARIAALDEVESAAAGADPDLAEIYRRRQQRRYHAQQLLARTLAARGALRPGLSPERATDISWALANPHMYRALTIQRGWTAEEYQHWLADLLAFALLPA
jgi:AcrR family transcriptional regulator